MFETWERRGTRSMGSWRRGVASPSAFRGRPEGAHFRFFSKKQRFFSRSLSRAPERTRAGHPRRISSGAGTARGRIGDAPCWRGSCPWSCCGRSGSARSRPIGGGGPRGDVGESIAWSASRCWSSQLASVTRSLMDSSTFFRREPWTRRASNMATCVLVYVSGVRVPAWNADGAEIRLVFGFEFLDWYRNAFRNHRSKRGFDTSRPRSKCASPREVGFGWRHLAQ